MADNAVPPPVWWSPSWGLLSAFTIAAGTFYSHNRDVDALYELPADAVRLVPAGGSAPADEPEYLADVERNAVALAAEVKRLKVALAGHIFDGESMNTREAIRHELILIGQEHGAEMERMRPVVEAAERWVDAPDSCASAMETADYVLRERLAVYRAGGSAPHQGATTDVTALLAHLDWLDERAAQGGHLLLRTDDVRALLAGKSIPIGPSADRALLGAGETTPTTPKETDHA